MTVLEAMACRCPVVAYPGGSVAEVISDGGVLVPDGDEAALRGAVSRLVADPAYRAEMAAIARARAQHFDLRRAVERLVSEYHAVLGTRPPNGLAASTAPQH
jgi:phosphatidylinositol alpha-mannosyltransferase